MTPDEARERFSEAWEGGLQRGEQVAFERALDADAALRDEYERFIEVAEVTRGLGANDDGPSVDLLPSLQARLRAQSGGRFFRDRFAQQRKNQALPVLVASAVVLVAAASWFVFRGGLW